MKKRLLILFCAVFFLALNLFLYVTVTRRLGNNYSGATQLKMVDVSKFLPFEEDSLLARTGASIHFSEGDDLPVLDGAAALVPVYASVIDNIYPEGCVTYKGADRSTFFLPRIHLKNR